MEYFRAMEESHPATYKAIVTAYGPNLEKVQNGWLWEFDVSVKKYILIPMYAFSKNIRNTMSKCLILMFNTLLNTEVMKIKYILPIILLFYWLPVSTMTPPQAHSLSL